jgi:tripartite-type tricarboxylate transporter receptor subunit TctC
MQRTKIIRSFSFVVFASVLFLTVNIVEPAESDYPSRPITFVSPNAPGGGIDINYRPIIDILPEYLGQKIVTLHKPGGGGAIAGAFVARAKPDGYTLFAGTTSFVILAPATRKSLPYSYDDFVPVGVFSKGFNTLIVKPDAPWKNLQELIADMKANPGKHKYATVGVGTQHHFLMEQLSIVAGFKAVHVPFKSDIESITAIMGGHTSFAIVTVMTAVRYLPSSSIRVLAIGDTVRSKMLPGVPTFKELGYDVEGILWVGLVAPKGTPKEIINKLWTAMKKAFEDNKIQPLIEQQGITAILCSPDEMDRIYRKDIAFYTKVAKDLGIEFD